MMKHRAGPRLPQLIALLLAALALPAAAAAQTAPASTYSFGATQVDCSSYYSTGGFDRVTRVAGGAGAVDSLQFIPGDLVELSSAQGARPGAEYRILRIDDGKDKNSQFAGQQQELSRMGHRVLAIGKVRVLQTQGDAALVRVETICDPIRVGDFGIPWQPRQVSSPVPVPAFSLSRIVSPAALAGAGLVVAARDFAGEAGPGDEIYLNRGHAQGARAGQTWLIVRAPNSPSEQWLHQTVRGLEDFSYPEKGVSVARIAPSARIPQVVGQAVVLWAETGGATAIITNARSVVYPGDQVIPQK